MTFLERFADRWMPEPNTGCYLWFASQTTAGYGNLTLDGETRYAHHCAYEQENGAMARNKKVRKKLVVRHSCDTPCCVNPKHLLIGTHKDNSDDMWRRGRGVSTRGQDHPRALLSQDDVILARQLVASGITISEVARRMRQPRGRINSAIIGSTRKGGSWSHLPGCVSPGIVSGERCRNAVLTEELVREIRRRKADGQGLTFVSRAMGLPRALVCNPFYNHSWNHVK